MQPPEPPTQLELNLLQAFQMLGQVRLQTTLLHEGTIQCIDKCMDRDDLFTLDRSRLPIAQRLKVDEKERTCVKNCGAKWDEIFRREGSRLMRTEQDLKTMEAMIQMQKDMAAAHAK